MDERSLILESQKGDIDSFNRLVLAYQNIVYSQAYRVMGEPNAADDATQETFISAFNKISTYRGGSFKAWLLRIVTNACYDELRRRKRRPTVSLTPQDSQGEPIESPNWLIDTNETPEETAERSEIREAIEYCLRNLPEEFREIILLVDLQGLDYRETSNVTGKPLGTVKSRLARARERMRECLFQFGELLTSTYRFVHESK
ncbi:MAG: RNA polymerase sigma factor [Anaerolineales bacterium]|jgi:RNA polymerase sigma-70 factor (ECF subfamily)